MSEATIATNPSAEEIEAARLILARADSAGAPPRYRAVVSLKLGGVGDRVLYSSISKSRVMKWIEAHCPRGSHIFMLGPDGEATSYEHERHTGGPRGEDIEVWQAFDRDAYQAPELAPVNTHDPWADAWEGAQ